MPFSIFRLVAACKKIEVDYFIKTAEHNSDSNPCELEQSVHKTSKNTELIRQIWNAKDSREDWLSQQLKIEEDNDRNSKGAIDDEDSTSVSSNETVIAKT